MNNNIFKKFFLSLLLLISCNIFCYANTNCYKVIKVIDGDTFYIDFNNNGIADKDERVRINGIDTFETKPSVYLDWQMKKFNLTQEEALGLGYLGKEFAKKELLNKYVRAEYTSDRKYDTNNRHLMSIYYKNKNYEQEVLKAGLATVYTKSNIAHELKAYENIDKLKENLQKIHKLNLVVLNLKNGKYHKTICPYGWLAQHHELIDKPVIKYSTANCCYKPPVNNKYNPYTKRVKPDAADGSIELYFLSPLKQKKPENNCKTSACKALLYNIDNAKESIDFAIYGIAEQDRIFKALIEAQKRGVKIRWVTDLTESQENIYGDTYRLMEEIPTFKTDYSFHEKEINSNAKNNFKFPHAAIMHDKFFIFDNEKVFTGSTNISSTCLTGYNSNVAVLINSKEIANLYEQEFEQMYSGKFHTDKAIINNNEHINLSNIDTSVYFSPMSKAISNNIIPLIRNAKTYIYIPAFYLTHPDLIEELISARQRGIEIKIIVDETSVNGDYVDIDKLKQHNIEVKVENWVGKMHMKSIIIDNNVLVIGSMNFTKQGERRNDENILIIKNAINLTTKYKKHFLDLWYSIN